MKTKPKHGAPRESLCFANRRNRIRRSDMPAANSPRKRRQATPISKPPQWRRRAMLHARLLKLPRARESTTRNAQIGSSSGMRKIAAKYQLSCDNFREHPERLPLPADEGITRNRTIHLYFFNGWKSSVKEPSSRKGFICFYTIQLPVTFPDAGNAASLCRFGLICPAGFPNLGT